MRGAMVAATAMGLALAGHVAGGGSAPASTTAIALFGLTAAGSVALSGRRWTLAELLTVLIGVQVVFHVAFGHQVGSSGVSVHEHAGHGVSASMLIAHLLASFAAALLLRRGESWCWRLIALLNRPVRVARLFVVRRVPGSAAGSVQPGQRPLPVLRSLLLVDAQPRRGPPALVTR
jgi:hypothetical protein